MSGDAVHYDAIVVGAGTAGLPAAISAADRGARVALIEASDAIGGTLRWSNGELSAAGTIRQRERGIEDDADAHFDDVIRLSKGMANAAIVRLAVDNAGATVDWLYENGFEMAPEVPRVIHSHQAYGTARTYWGVNQAMSVVEVLERLLEPHVACGRVTLLLETQLEALVSNERGEVIGVRVADRDGATREILGSQIALTSGGCVANPSRFEALHGFPPYLRAYCPTNTGQGLTAALALGARARGAEAYTPAFNAVLADDGPSAPLVCRLNTIPEWRMPWEIYVNVHGKRFVREDGDSIDARERALFDQPGMSAWMVFDDAILAQAPDRIRKWYGQWADRQPEDPFTELDAFARAGSIAELASISGIDPVGLEATIETFNAAQRGGRKDPLGRRHAPLPIASPPFYAIRFQGCSVFSAAGLEVDPTLRVLREDGRAIPNLFAAGEVLGAWQTMGQGNSSGMMATPALTFGRLLGGRFMRWSR